jgi:hypothetical protein
MKRILLTTLCLLTLLSLALACLSCNDQTPPDVPPDGPSTEDDQTNNQGTTDTPDAPNIPTQPDADAAYVFARGEKGDFMPLKHYPADDLIICSKNVLDYGAQPDGSKDATKAFQRALDAVATMGGGTVYAPAGQYYFADRLLIPDAVTLCGDWVSPEEEAAGTRGTVLIFDHSAQLIPAFICKAFRWSLTIFYHPLYRILSPRKGAFYRIRAEVPKFEY